MTNTAHFDDEPLTPAERAQLRRLLRLLQRGAGELVDAPKPVAVVREPKKIDPVEYVSRLRRRKGQRRG